MSYIIKSIAFIFLTITASFSSASEKPTTITEVIAENLIDRITFSVDKLQPDNDQLTQCLLSIDKGDLHKKIKNLVDKELSLAEQHTAESYLNSATYRKVNKAHKAFVAQKLDNLDAPIDMDGFVDSLTHAERLQIKTFDDSNASKTIMKISGDFSMIDPILKEWLHHCGVEH